MSDENLNNKIDALNSKIENMQGLRQSTVITAIVSAAATVAVAFIANAAQVIIGHNQENAQFERALAQQANAREQVRLERDLDLQTTLILDALENETLQDQVATLGFYKRIGLLGDQRVAVNPEGLEQALAEANQTLENAGPQATNLPPLGRVNDASGVREVINTETPVSNNDLRQLRDFRQLLDSTLRQELDDASRLPPPPE